MNARSLVALVMLAALVAAPTSLAFGVDAQVKSGLLTPLRVRQDVPLPSDAAPLAADVPSVLVVDVDAPAATQAAVHDATASFSEGSAPEDAPTQEDASPSEASGFRPLRAHRLLLPLAVVGAVPVLGTDVLGAETLIGPLLPPAEAPMKPSEAPIEAASVEAPVVSSAPEPLAAVAAGVSVVAVAAASAAAPAVGLGWERLKRLALLAALYTRIAKERLLDHGSRERLLGAIREAPGLPLTDLAARTGVPRNTATYHLRRLEREGLVVSSRSGRVRVWFVPGAGARREEAPAYAALRHDTTRAIALEVATTPGVDQQALCQRFGLAPSLAHWHADRLIECGLVRKERDGRRVRYYPTEGLPRVAGIGA